MTNAQAARRRQRLRAMREERIARMSDTARQIYRQQVDPAISSGRARALAVTTPKRTPLIPDCPTTKEAGFPGVDYVYWVGFSGPPALPAQIIEIFTQTAEEILRDPDVADRLAKKFDAVPAFLPTDSFRQFIQDEASKINRLQGLMSGGK